MSDFYGGLKRRIMEGRPAPVRDYAAEVEASIQSAAMRQARSKIAEVIVMLERDGGPGQDTELLREALDALS